MFAFTKKQTQKMRNAAAEIAAQERELAVLRLQREAMQKTLYELLTLKKEGPDHAGS